MSEVGTCEFLGDAVDVGGELFKEVSGGSDHWKMCISEL